MRAEMRKLEAVLGTVIGIAGLVWIFKDVRFAELRADVAGMRWIWIVPAVLCDALGYLLQAERWNLLLRPVGRLGAGWAAQAIYAALFVNEIAPMRAGEAVRAGIAARRLGVGIPRVLPSIAAERLFDGLWLAVYIAVVAAFVRLPLVFVRAADLLVGVVLVGALVLVVLIFGRPLPETAGRGGRMARWLGGLKSEIRVMGRSRGFYFALALSALPQLFEALALWLLLRAYAIPLPIWSGIAAALILRLGTAVPGAPGNIGTWQLLCVVALTLLGVQKTQAAGFSVVAFVILTLPLWGLGWLALARSRTRS